MSTKKPTSETAYCPECKTTAPLRRAEVPYGLGGKWSVLVPAKVYDCPCGGGEQFEAIEPMHRAIAAAVVAKKTRLAPEEIRFLRLQLDLTAIELGKLLGVSFAQVSRWEHGAPMNASADRLLRMLTAKHDGAEYDVHHLAEITDKPGAPLRLRLTRNKAGAWQAAA